MSIYWEQAKKLMLRMNIINDQLPIETRQKCIELFSRPPDCDGGCGNPAASDGRGGYKMVGGCDFWCGDKACWHKIQEKIVAGHAAYDVWRREQIATRNFNESGKEI